MRKERQCEVLRPDGIPPGVLLLAVPAMGAEGATGPVLEVWDGLVKKNRPPQPITVPAIPVA